MVLKITPTVLNTPYGTQDIPHIYHEAPDGTQDIPHGTERPHSTAHPHGTAHTLYRVPTGWECLKPTCQWKSIKGTFRI